MPFGNHLAAVGNPWWRYSAWVSASSRCHLGHHQGCSIQWSLHFSTEMCPTNRQSAWPEPSGCCPSSQWCWKWPSSLLQHFGWRGIAAFRRPTSWPRDLIGTIGALTVLSGGFGSGIASSIGRRSGGYLHHLGCWRHLHLLVHRSCDMLKWPPIVSAATAH